MNRRDIAMSAYFSREFVEQVNAQMVSGHASPRNIPPKVRALHREQDAK